MMSSTFRCLATGILLASYAEPLLAQKIVKVVRPERKELSRSAPVPGSIIAEETLELRALVTGTIQSIPVDIGSSVKRGELLVRLAVPDLEAERARGAAALRKAEASIRDAEASVSLARANLSRAEAEVEVCAADIKLKAIIHRRSLALFERKGATRAELDEAEGQLAMARANGRAVDATVKTNQARVRAADVALESARASADLARAEVERLDTLLGFATLTCPFEQAVVTRRFLHHGALVRKGESLILELARMDRVRVEMHVPERDAILVSKGTRVELRLDARPGEVIQASVSRTSRSLSRSRNLSVQVDLDNKDWRYMPGMFLYATLRLGTAESVMLLPAGAVRIDKQGQAYIFVARAGKARRVRVETGADDGVRIAIKNGLSGNEAVIVGSDLVDGASVRVQEAGAGK